MSAGGVARRKGRSAVTQHPLKPLRADEFRRTTAILRRDGHVTDTFRFASIELMEPGKQQRGQQLASSATTGRG
jgi:Cu2+-containing amine oxidase